MVGDPTAKPSWVRRSTGRWLCEPEGCHLTGDRRKRVPRLTLSVTAGPKGSVAQLSPRQTP